MVDLIRPFTFVVINHDELNKEHGIVQGDTLFVASAQAFPLSEDDPYTQRIFLFAQRLKEDELIDDEGGFYVIDPKSVNNLSKEENDRLSLLNLQIDENATVN